MLDLFAHGFMQRALLTGLLIGASCALLGPFLVLRNYAIIGEGLAHIAFTGIAIAFLLGWAPLPVTIAVTVAGALLIAALRSRVQGDAAIGIVYTSIFALGLLLLSLTNRITVDLFGFLFGNILSISLQETVASALLAILVAGALFAKRLELTALTLDETLARSTGVRTGLLSTLLLVLTAVTVVLAIRVVGVLLVGALIIIPASAALNLAGSFRGVMLWSVALASVAVIGGILGAAALDLAAGAAIVLSAAALFLLSLGVQLLRSQNGSA